MNDRVGQRLGNYRLVRLLGRGGFAEVYLGEHLRLNTYAAVKVLYTRLANSDEVESFQKEARTIAHLEHSHIVRVFDFDVVNDTPFLVMSYAAGGTLRQCHPKGSILPLPTIISYVKQVADALQYAHDQRLIHRDIKPENMLVGQRNEVLLSDFGIATVAQSSRYQSSQDLAGTIAYMAPEQIQAHPRPASDQYSLGIVVYEWLSGDRPFQGSYSEIAVKQTVVPPPSLREKVSTISPDIEQVVITALAKDPKERFGSIQAFATALEQAWQVEQVRSAAPTILEKPPVLSESPSPSGSAPTIPAPSPISLVQSTGETPFIATVPVDKISTDKGIEPTIPVVSTSESNPLPTLLVPGPFEPTEVASSLSTSPDIPKISSSALPAAPSKRNASRIKKPLIISLVSVLVLIGGVVGWLIYAANTVNRAIATDAINNTIAQTDATNISHIDPSLVTSNPDPYPPSNGKLTLYDPMHDNSNQGFGWQVGNGCTFTGTSYQVAAACSANNVNLNDFAFEITVDFTETNSVQGADVFFRDVDSPNAWYAFTIYNDGTWDFQADAENLLGKYVTPIITTGNNSDAIHQGEQTNVIAVVANGSTIDLYVNGVRLNRFNDNTSNYGGIFLSNEGAAVNFSNAKLWTF